METFYFKVLLLLALHFFVPGEGAVPFTSIVKGVFFEGKNNTIIYQKSIPLSFLIDLPKVDNTFKHTPCNSEPQICKLKIESEKVHQAIIADTIANHPYLVTLKNRQRRGLIDGVGKIDKYLFGIATTGDVDELHASEVAISGKVLQLQENLVSQHQYLAQVSGNITAWSKKLTASFEQNIDQVRQDLLNTADTVYRGEGTLAEISLLAMKNQYLIYVTNKINSAAESCRNNRIPRIILTDSVLLQRIDSIVTSLDSEGYVIATDISGLMKMDIADCSFSPSKVKVTVHIPLKRKNTVYTLYEVLAIPWQFNHQQCRVMDVSPFVVKVGDSLMPISGHVAKYCRPQVQNACYVPENERDSSSFSDCAKALFALSVPAIKQFCVFHCYTSNKTRITEVSPGRVAITNAKTVALKCDVESKSLNYTSPVSDGAVLLNIPCFCTAIVNDFHTVKSPYPCMKRNDDPLNDVVHVIPVQWSLLSGLLLEDNAKYSNLTEIFDREWTLKIPTLNVTPPNPLSTSSTQRFQELVLNYSNDKLAIIVWLTVITTYLCLQFYLPSKTNTSGFSRGKLSLLLCNCVAVAAEEGKSEPILANLLWDLLKAIEIGNWILAILVGLSFLIILWFVIKMYRFARCTYDMTRSLFDDVELPRRR